MALSVLQTGAFPGAFTQTASSIVGLTPGTPSAQSCLCAMIRNGGGVSLSSVSDNVNGNWSVTSPVSDGTRMITFAYFPNCVASRPTITASFSGSATGPEMFFWEVGGAATSSPLDVFTGALSASAANPVSTPTFSTTHSNDILLIAGTFNGTIANSSSGPTWGASGFTMDSTGYPTYNGTPPTGNGFFCGAGHLVVSSIQSSITKSIGWSGGSFVSGSSPSVSWLGLAAIKDNSVAPTGPAPNSLMMMGCGI